MHDFERLLIGADTAFLLSLVRAASLGELLPTLWMGLLPHAALFTIESQACLDAMPGGHATLPADVEEFVQRSRTRIKLLGDRDGDALALFRRVQKQHNAEFLGAHRGLLAPLKRLIQPDLGLTEYAGSLVLTTHVVDGNLGGEDPAAGRRTAIRDQGAIVKHVATAMGAYLGMVLKSLGRPTSTTSLDCRLSPPLVKMTDVKAGSYYAAIAARVSPGEPEFASYLTAVLSNVNVVHILMRGLLPPASLALFKAKFVVAFHALRSILSMQADGRSRGILSSAGVKLFADLVSSSSARWVRKQEQLRNVLVHYAIRPEQARAKLREDLPLLGLVEALAPKTSFAQADESLDHVLGDLSSGLGEVVARPVPRWRSH
jgi:hypothetical protein